MPGKPTTPPLNPQSSSRYLLSKRVEPSDPAKFARQYGMRLGDVHAYESRNGVNGVVNMYERQRIRARERRIEWLFDLKSWLAVWDGKIAKRGKGYRALCMCRHKDEGPYAPWNVRIATGYENRLDWWEKKPHWYRQQGVIRPDGWTGTSPAVDQGKLAVAKIEINTRFGAK